MTWPILAHKEGSGVRLLPPVRQQVAQLADRGGGDLGEHAGQVSLRVEAMTFSDGKQTVERGIAASAAIAAETPHIQYVWDITYIDTPVCRLRDMNGDGDFDFEGEGVDEALYYTTDANRNVTALIDADTGAVVERYVFAPYGRTTIYAPDWSGEIAPADSARNERTFAGYQFQGCVAVIRRYDVS